MVKKRGMSKDELKKIIMSNPVMFAQIMSSAVIIVAGGVGGFYLYSKYKNDIKKKIDEVWEKLMEENSGTYKEATEEKSSFEKLLDAIIGGGTILGGQTPY